MIGIVEEPTGIRLTIRRPGSTGYTTCGALPFVKESDATIVWLGVGLVRIRGEGMQPNALAKLQANQLRYARAARAIPQTVRQLQRSLGRTAL